MVGNRVDNRLRPDERAERRRAIAPLFAWMDDHGVIASHVIGRVYEAHGRSVSRSYSSIMKRGLCPLPTWLIPDCCAAMRVPVHEVYPDTPSGVYPPVPARAYSTRHFTGRVHRLRLQRRGFLVEPPLLSPALPPSEEAGEAGEATSASVKATVEAASSTRPSRYSRYDARDAHDWSVG